MLVFSMPMFLFVPYFHKKEVFLWKSADEKAYDWTRLYEKEPMISFAQTQNRPFTQIIWDICLLKEKGNIPLDSRIPFAKIKKPEYAEGAFLFRNVLFQPLLTSISVAETPAERQKCRKAEITDWVRMVLMVRVIGLDIKKCFQIHQFAVLKHLPYISILKEFSDAMALR